MDESISKMAVPRGEFHLRNGVQNILNEVVCSNLLPLGNYVAENQPMRAGKDDEHRFSVSEGW